MNNQYWEQEFNNAYEMLLLTLYTVKGYSYSDEIGTLDKDPNLQIKLIDVRSDIKRDRRKGTLYQKYMYYANLIYKIIRV